MVQTNRIIENPSIQKMLKSIEQTVNLKLGEHFLAHTFSALYLILERPR